MILKVMLADQTFDLIDRVKKCSFRKAPEGASVNIEHDDGTAEQRPVTHKVYVLNVDGRTIDTFQP